MNYQDYLKNTYKNNNLKNSSKLNPVLILVDIEGIIGVYNINDMKKNIKLAYYEIYFIISELKRAKFNNITVCNIHDDGMCLSKNEIEKLGAKLIRGVKEFISSEQNYKYTFMIGFHGKRNSGGKFDHTFRDDIYKMYYGKKSIGEVGAFYRWLSLKNNIVIMISGEGYFEDEVKEYPVIIHKNNIINFTKEEIAQKYKTLHQALQKAIGIMYNKNFKIHKISKEKVYITVTNSDKYYMVDKKFKRIKNGRAFVFLSLQHFFEKVYDFALELNKITQKIYVENIKFIKLIKDMQYERAELDKVLQKYLNKNILEINCYDRKKIKDKLGIKYEDFCFY